MTVTSACWPQIPPGPTFTETTVTPSPVVAGSTFTLTATASTTNGKVNHLALIAVATPSGGGLPRNDDCSPSPVESGLSAPEVTAVWECTIPLDAPSGTWVVKLRAFDQGYGQTDVDVPFEVVGGSDDVEGPQLSLTIPPTVARGTSFDLTIRAVDQHGPANLSDWSYILLYNNWDEIVCASTTWTAVDAVTWDYTTTCAVAAELPVGPYLSSPLVITDRFGQGTRLDVTTTVV